MADRVPENPPSFLRKQESSDFMPAEAKTLDSRLRGNDGQKQAPISAIAKRVSSGLTPLRSNLEFWQNGTIPWLKTEQLGEKYIYSTTEKISEAALKKTSIKVYPPDTITIAMYGEGATRGNVSIIKNEMATNQACCNVEIDPELADVEYVYYFLKTQYHALRNLSSGVRKNLNSEDIKSFVVRFPKDIPEQQKIAAVLSALDAKIELNNRINAELEALAKTIYDYWFVQFDFPDAHGRPYRSSGGAMVWNDTLKHEIPAGWGAESLWDIATYTNGLAMQKFRPAGDAHLPVIKIKEMSDGFTSDTERASPSIPGKCIVDDGDVLFSWSATLAVQIWTYGRGALNQHIFKVTSEKYPKTYFYFQLLDYLGHFKMMAEKRKTTMGHITLDHLRQAFVVKPPQGLTQDINDRLRPIFEQSIGLSKQSQQLMDLRDWLLPLLMNGQVRVAGDVS